MGTYDGVGHESNTEVFRSAVHVIILFRFGMSGNYPRKISLMITQLIVFTSDDVRAVVRVFDSVTLVAQRSKSKGNAETHAEHGEHGSYRQHGDA